MMRSSLTIPVGDLLKQIGSKDTISFEGIMLEAIPGLRPDGLTGHIELMSIADDTILARLSLEAHIDDVSDLSGQEFIRKVEVDDFQAEYLLPDRAQGLEATDEFFVIDGSHMTIEISDLLAQSVLLQRPLLTLAPGESRPIGEDHYEDSLRGSVTITK